MLPFPLQELDESIFQRVCAEQWPESQTLEFKALLPSNDEDARQEFRKDVCALANADGGDLIYGISEKASRASTILPIEGTDFDGVKRRLRQILESKVEPRIHGIQFQHCQLAAGGFVLVLRVPNSFNGPHRFGPPREHRFVFRSDTMTSDMTYDQLRNSFGRGATLLEKAAQFRFDRIEKIAAGHAPQRMSKGAMMVLHLIPLGGLAGQADVDIPGLHADFSSLRLENDHRWTRATNLNGLVMYPYDDSEDVDWCSQIFRNGAFEVLRDVRGQSADGRGSDAVVGPWVARTLRNALQVYARASAGLGVHGSIVLSLSLTRTRGTVLATNGRSFTRNPILEDRLDLPEILIEDIGANLKIDELTRPHLDVLYQCYGAPRCNLFDDKGQWTLGE